MKEIATLVRGPAKIVSQLSQDLDSLLFDQDDSKNSDFKVSSPLIKAITWALTMKRLKQIGLSQEIMEKKLDEVGEIAWWEWMKEKMTKDRLSVEMIEKIIEKGKR